MSKGLSYLYFGTKGHIADVAHSFPKIPDDLLKSGWKEITDPRAAENSSSRTFIEEKTGLKIRFDKGIDGKNGFAGQDHYHIENPNATGKDDRYLDISGNPVKKNSKASHILPNGGKKQ